MQTPDVLADFEAVLDQVVDDCDHVIVSHERGKAVVMLSLDEWNSIEETLHLMDAPANAVRLSESISDATNVNFQ
jgi:antitoxin YefM